MRKSELLSDLSNMINARSEGVRLLLKNSGVFLPENEKPTLVKIYEAAQKDSSFMRRLFEFKNSNVKLAADGSSLWVWIGNILSGVGTGVAKSATDSASVSDNEIIQYQLQQEAKEQKEKEAEKSETLKWVAVGVVFLLVVIVAVVVLRKRKG